jgi:hypothetical protein
MPSAAPSPAAGWFAVALTTLANPGGDAIADGVLFADGVRALAADRRWLPLCCGPRDTGRASKTYSSLSS